MSKHRPLEHWTDEQLDQFIEDARAIERRRAARNRLAFESRRTFAVAVREGLVSRPPVCSKCGVAGRIEGHHEDYSRPLDVVWLCRPCHRGADKARRAREGWVPAVNVLAQVTERIYRQRRSAQGGSAAA